MTKTIYSLRKTIAIMLSVILAVTGLFVYSTDNKVFADDGAYLFAYFTGNGREEQQVRFAVSTDGLKYDLLNDNAPVITAVDTDGDLTHSSGCSRDPYIAKAQDGTYYIIATDMDASEGGIHSSWRDDTNFYVWHSANLIDWEMVSNFDCTTFGDTLANGEAYNWADTIRAWAPQFVWDANEGKYMVYWANYLSNWSCCVMYSYTSDFVNFSTPDVLYKASVGAAIDSDIIYNSADNKYYMYYKDETQGTICYVTADNLTGPYSQVPVPVCNDGVALEGCNCHFVNGKLIMFADAYLNGFFVALESTDFKKFNLLQKSDYAINHLSPRHGSVVKISTEEYNNLVERFGKAKDRFCVKEHRFELTSVKPARIAVKGQINYSCALCKAKEVKTIACPKTIEISQESYAYTGQPINPDVVVKDENGDVIDSEFYSVVYSDGCTDEGTYKITVTLSKNYDAVLTKEFSINKKVEEKPTAPAAETPTQTTSTTKPVTEPQQTATPVVKALKTTTLSKVTAGKKQFKASWKKVSGVTGYQIQYSTSSKFTKKTTKTVTVKGASKTSTTVKKLSGKKKYYVRIRTYKGKQYSSWSKSKTVTTKK